MSLQSHEYLGVTQSLCPECLRVVQAKIINRRGRIYFRKFCPEHGQRDDFVCSDATQYDRMEFNTPGRFPKAYGVQPEKGCPYDCGICTSHEQHTCVGLVEVTSSCNLSCPMCYASSGPGGRHLSYEECVLSIDRLVEVEGRPEVLQLSGGEPTIHPDFERILRYACEQPIDIVMINTNGLRIARDRSFIKILTEFRKRIEIYLQFDGFTDDVYRSLRGEALLEDKLKAIDALGTAGVRTILVSTLQTDVNDDQIGRIVEFGAERSFITGVSLQPATYSGRFTSPETLERRLTFPDVIQTIENQTAGLFRRDDFMPLPCAHPNCHSLTYAYRSPGEKPIPLLRFIDAKNNLDLLANGITFTRPRARRLLERYLGGLGCCAGGSCEPSDSPGAANRVASADVSSRPIDVSALKPLIGEKGIEFFERALSERLDPEDVFRITITSFLDAFNFDVRRLMKCCIHHVLPSGHLIPFCAYNVLYREGHLPLPTLKTIAVQPNAEARLAPLKSSVESSSLRILNPTG